MPRWCWFGHLCRFGSDGPEWRQVPLSGRDCFPDTDLAALTSCSSGCECLQAAYPDQLLLHPLQPDSLQFPVRVQAAVGCSLCGTCMQCSSTLANSGCWWVDGFNASRISTNARMSGRAQQGMQGQRAQLLHGLVGIVSSLQQQCSPPPTHLSAGNVIVQHHRHREQQISAAEFNSVCSMLVVDGMYLPCTTQLQQHNCGRPEQKP